MQRKDSPDDSADLLSQLLQKLSQLNDLTSLVQTKVPNARIIQNPQDDASESGSDDSLHVLLEQEIHLTRQQKDRVALAADLLKRDKNHESLREQIKLTKVFDDISIRENEDKKNQKPFIKKDTENLINIEIEKEILNQHNSKSKNTEKSTVNVRETNVCISDEISFNPNNDALSKFQLVFIEIHNRKNPLPKSKDDFFTSRNQLVDKINEKAQSKWISEYIREYADDETFKIIL